MQKNVRAIPASVNLYNAETITNKKKRTWRNVKKDLEGEKWQKR